MKTSVTRTIAALAALPCLVAVATPANAAPKDTFTSKTTGGQANVQWTEYDLEDTLGLPGNTHVGFLSVFKMSGFTDVFGAIEDYECDPGEAPGGGHGEPGGEATCDLLGTRFLSAGADVGYTADTRAGVATLTGNLVVSNGGHGEPGSVLGNPPVNITWTASSDPYTFRRTETWSNGTVSFSSAVRGTGFEATVSGRIGAMGFTDDADDVSSGNAEQWSERSRQRIG